MTDDYVVDNIGTKVTFKSMRCDGNGDAELKLHKRYGTTSSGAKDQIGVDLMIDNRFITVTGYWSSLNLFKTDIEKIFRTMRQNYPIALYLYDHDGTIAFNGSNVMPHNYAWNYDCNRGAQHRVEGKVNFALASYFVL